MGIFQRDLSFALLLVSVASWFRSAMSQQPATSTSKLQIRVSCVVAGHYHLFYFKSFPSLILILSFSLIIPFWVLLSNILHHSFLSH